MNGPSPAQKVRKGRLNALVFAYQGAAQFQLVAGGSAGVSVKVASQIRATAAAAAEDAADRGLPAGRARRIGLAECFAIAIPSIVRESMSGRDGLAVSIAFLSRGFPRANAAFLLQALCSVELSLSNSVSATPVPLVESADLLTASLQSGDDLPVAARLARHLTYAEQLLSATARVPQRSGRLTIQEATSLARHDQLPYRMLATLTAGLRASSKSQQVSAVRIGLEAPPRAKLTACQFLHDLVIVAHEA